MAEGDRMARAGDYVLGLMSDADRERAERDLEIDPAFRDAVLQLADRMHVFDRIETPDGQPDERWKLITERIAEMPQMRASALDGGDARRPAVMRQKARPAAGERFAAVPNWRAMLICLGMAIAFGLGYLVGRL